VSGLYQVDEGAKEHYWSVRQRQNSNKWDGKSQVESTRQDFHGVLPPWSIQSESCCHFLVFVIRKISQINKLPIDLSAMAEK